MNLAARRRAGGSVHAMKKIAGGTTCLRVCWLKERSHMTHNHPTSAEGLTPAYLNGLLAETLPEARVETVNVIDAKTYGEQMVSTAGRVIIDVTYAAGSPPTLPRNLVVKVERGVDKKIGRGEWLERGWQYR